MLSALSCCCRALELAHESDTLLVVGSSLMVYSAFRLSKAAKAGNGRLAILSAGPTRADAMADLKVSIAGSLLMTNIISCDAALPAPDLGMVYDDIGRHSLLLQQCGGRCLALAAALCLPWSLLFVAEQSRGLNAISMCRWRL